ncbi:MAG TPA: MFS transporter [Spirillospora sp.]
MSEVVREVTETKRNTGRTSIGGTRSLGRPIVMLVTATLGFALNFWAWALLSPLAPRFQESLGLTSFEQSLLVAVPVVVGSLGRIPVGALTDRFGGRVMFPALSIVTIAPVLFLGILGNSSLAALLVGGFVLGVAGTVFAVGVPFVGAWFPPERRGLALGVFGAGMGGTAITALTTVPLVDARGLAFPFELLAVVLAVYAAAAWLVLREAPGRGTSGTSLIRRMAGTLRLPVTWQMSALYAVTFGGFVAFSVYLPTYLREQYGLAQADASNRMAGFVLLAVLMRPFGGWLSDRIGAVRVMVVSLAVTVAGAAVQASAPPLTPLGTIAFLAMAAALGAGSGATFALVAQLAPAGGVGAVTGVVGAAGGLGGFVPPLIMGAVYGAFGTYALGLVLLALVAATAAVFTATVVQRAAANRQSAGAGRGG